LASGAKETIKTLSSKLLTRFLAIVKTVFDFMGLRVGFDVF